MPSPLQIPHSSKTFPSQSQSPSGMPSPLQMPHSSKTFPSQSQDPSAIPSPLQTPHSSYSPTQSSTSSHMPSSSLSSSQSGLYGAIVLPVKENPKTVFPLEETVKPEVSATPPLASIISFPLLSTLN